VKPETLLELLERLDGAYKAQAFFEVMAVREWPRLRDALRKLLNVADAAQIVRIDSSEREQSERSFRAAKVLRTLERKLKKP
jgi:hypothetical protein